MGWRTRVRQCRREQPSWTAESSFSYVAPPRSAYAQPFCKHRALSSIPGILACLGSMGHQRDGGAGGLAAGIAFPMVADLAAFDEFGCDRRDHQVVAIGTT